MKAERKLVSFIGLGSKSAVPLLYSYIDLHPDVFVAPEETKFFSSPKAFAKGVDWYESHFQNHKAGQVCGELATTYLKNPTAASLISRAYPSANLIAVVENPLVSVRVAYVNALRARAIPDDMPLAIFLNQNPEVLVNAKYGKLLNHYFGYYAQTNLLTIVAADVRDDTLKVMAKVYEHIGVDSAFVPSILEHLVPVVDDPLVKKPGFIKRGYRAIKKLVKFLYYTTVNKINPPDIPKESSSDVARAIKLSPEVKVYLQNYYRQDVVALSNIMGRNLSVEWGFEAPEPEMKPR